MFIPLVVSLVNQASPQLAKINRDLSSLDRQTQQANRSTNSLGNSLSANATRNSTALSQQNQQIQQFKNQQNEILLNERVRASSKNVELANLNLQARQERLQTNDSVANRLAVLRAENQLNAAKVKNTLAQNQLNFANRKEFDFLNAGLQNGAKGYNNLASSAANSMSGIVASTSAANLAMGALTVGVGVGLVAAFQTLSTVATYTFDQISGSIQRQAENISAAEPLVKSFGVSYQEADKNVRKQQVQIAELGRDLPVSSQQINAVATGISDNLARAVKNAGKDINALPDYVNPIASRLAILADNAGVETSNANLLFNKLDSGSSIGNLRQLAIYERSPALQNALEDTFKKYNIKNTKELNPNVKADFLKEIFERSVSQEQINRLQGTVKAQISSFQDKLFDPYIGLFGFERDLKPETDKIDSISSEIFRGFGLLSEILGKISTIIGGTGDPLKDVYKALEGFNNWLDSVNRFLGQFTASQQKIEQTRAAVQPALTLSGTFASGLMKAGRGDIFGAGKDIITGTSTAVQQVVTPPGQQPSKKNIFETGLRGLFPTFFSNTAKPSADGFIPVQNAIQQEIYNKPANSQLLIANSSETVLNRDQVKALSGNRITNKSASNSVSVGSINIYPTANQDPKSIAETVIREIENRFSSSVEAILT